jgi:fructose/tagatose bisphosphate aldolase
MKFVPMGELLQQAVSEGYGVPSLCVWNAESIEVVLGVPASTRSYREWTSSA